MTVAELYPAVAVTAVGAPGALGVLLGPMLMIEATEGTPLLFTMKSM